MSTIYELDFPCGCHTQKFDPREWTLCDRHGSANEAIVEWAAEGARLVGRVTVLRQALAAYRSALRSGEPESDQLRNVGDDALAGR